MLPDPTPTFTPFLILFRSTDLLWVSFLLEGAHSKQYLAAGLLEGSNKEPQFWQVFVKTFGFTLLATLIASEHSTQYSALWCLVCKMPQFKQDLGVICLKKAPAVLPSTARSQSHRIPRDLGYLQSLNHCLKFPISLAADCLHEVPSN